MVLKQNHVIKNFILLSSILFFAISCTKIDDDYAILNKVIDTYLPSSKTPFYLMEKGEYHKSCLKMHYMYKYDKKEYNKFLKINSDYIDRTIAEGNMGKEYIKYTLPYMYLHKNCINDSIFKKKEMQYFLTHQDSIHWNKNKINNDKVIVLKHRGKRHGYSAGTGHYYYYISKPIYNRDKKLAIVSCQSYRGNIELLTLKKIDGLWGIINKIENHY